MFRGRAKIYGPGHPLDHRRSTHQRVLPAVQQAFFLARTMTIVPGHGRGISRRGAAGEATSRMSGPKRIICVGHAALDRIYRIETFPPQPTKVRALEHVETGGGMAANASVAVARLGGKAELWSRVGDDGVGATIRAGLKAEHVDVRYVQSFEGARSST